METKLEINETLELDPQKDYPFRSSLINVARCGKCKQGNRVPCGADGELVTSCKTQEALHYPLMVKEHSCEDYKYKPHFIYIVPDGKINIGFVLGLIDKLEECDEYASNFHNYCSGIKWFPFDQKEGKCEFFRDKQLLCKYAIPCFQYGTTTRNNYCRLNPKKRDPSLYPNMTWKVMCPFAHKKGINSYKCYKPKKKVRKKNGT